jgi:SPP1 family predicted phage head-tail adaptor
MKRTAPGKRRHILSVQRKDETNVDGDIATVWTEIATVWARVRPLSGREFFTAKQEYADVTHMIEFPYDSRMADLDAKHRLVYRDSKYYDLLSVQQQELDLVEFLIYATERNQ